MTSVAFAAISSEEEVDVLLLSNPIDFAIIACLGVMSDAVR